MPSQQELLIKKILKTIDSATEQFNSNIPSLQRQILNDITVLIKDFDLSSDGSIKNSVKNLKLVGQIKNKLEKLILNDSYLKSVKEFVSAFDQISKLQNQYFNLIEKKYKPPALLKEIQKQSIGAAITSLTEAGIGSNVTEQIQKMLRVNVTTGGSFAELTTQLRNSILSNKTGGGLLERYTRQVAEDSIQQFNRQYASAVSDDLGLNWFVYTGTLIETSREWCRELVKKRYVHRSELKEIVEGQIDEHHVKINPKTKVWAGGIPGTNESNVTVYAGGYLCKHLFAPVSAAVVPANIRAQFPD